MEGDAEFYAAISKSQGYYSKDKYEFKYLLNKMRDIKPDSVLEIGCGNGYFLEHLVDSFDVRATENNPEAIKELKKKGILLDDDNRKYDLICSFQVFEHIKKLGEYLEWVIGKLNSGGYLFFSVPNPDSTLFQETSQPIDCPPHHMVHIHKDTMYKFAEIFGLEVVDYFAEPLKNDLGMFCHILSQREKMFTTYDHGFWKGFIKKLNQSVKMALLPILMENTSFTGHTHGVLLKRNN